MKIQVVSTSRHQVNSILYILSFYSHIHDHFVQSLCHFPVFLADIMVTVTRVWMEVLLKTLFEAPCDQFMSKDVDLLTGHAIICCDNLLTCIPDPKRNYG